MIRQQMCLMRKHTHAHTMLTSPLPPRHHHPPSHQHHLPPHVPVPASLFLCLSLSLSLNAFPILLLQRAQLGLKCLSFLAITNVTTMSMLRTCRCVRRHSAHAKRPRPPTPRHRSPSRHHKPSILSQRSPSPPAPCGASVRSVISFRANIMSCPPSPTIAAPCTPTCTHAHTRTSSAVGGVNAVLWSDPTTATPAAVACVIRHHFVICRVLTSQTSAHAHTYVGLN